MVSLKWGDALSIVLPGAVALFAIAPWFPTLKAWIDQPNNIGAAAGGALLIAAAVVGGALEAWTRIAWEKHWLLPHSRPKVDAFALLREKENRELFELGVQSSYKYATFYANFAWATLILLISREWYGTKPSTAATLLLSTAIIVLLRASHVQWTYYVEYVNRVFGPRSDDAAKSSTPGDAGPIHGQADRNRSLG